MSSRTNKVIKGTVASALQYGVYIILQALLAPLVLKVAGQETLGAYAILMQIIGYGILLDLGFSVALSRYLSQTYGFHDQGKRFSEVFTIGRVFLLVTNLVFALFIFIVALRIESVIVANKSIIVQARFGFYLLAIWMIAKTPLVIYNDALFATQNMAVASLNTIIGNVSRVILSLGLVYFGMGLVGLVVANISSEYLTFVLQKRCFRKKYPNYLFGWQVSDRQLFKEMFSFGVKYFGVNLAVVLFLGSDNIVVGNLYGAYAASVYYTTKIPAFLLFQFIFRISDNAAPAMNELFAQCNYKALDSAYLKLLRYSLLLALPLSVGIIGFNRGVISAWVGPVQFAGDLMSLALALFVTTQVINHLNAMVTLAVGNMRHWSMVSIITSTVSLGLSYWFGKIFGMQWVMVAIALMDLPNAVFLFYRCLEGLKISVRRLWHEACEPALLASLPLCMLVVYLKIMDPMATVYSVISYVALFITLWGVCVFTMGLNISEKELLKKNVKYT